MKVSNAGSESGREVRDEHGYALFHDPACRTRYAKNLKRELTRIPFIGVAADVRRLKSPCGGSQKKSEPPHVGCCKGTSFFPLCAIEKMQGDAKPDRDPKASAKLFQAFAAAGKKLADLRVNYESAQEFPVKRQESLRTATLGAWGR